MRVIKTTTTRTCVVCERTLLQGEHALRYSPDGTRFVDVCPLCTDAAVDHGWVKEGVSVSPVLQVAPRRRRGGTWSIGETDTPSLTQPWSTAASVQSGQTST